jgi:methylase of polypeptide subunit release factors
VPSTPPCSCPACPNLFSDAAARDGLRRYLRRGPDPTTRSLIEAIEAEGIGGATVLDIGGGVGVVSLELLARGARAAQSVDASAPYVAVATAEAARRGYADRSSHLEGDFVALAGGVEPADIVTLDRMVCCYGNMPALVGEAAGHARRMIGFVYPRDAAWVRAIATVMNLGERLLRRSQRWHIHSERGIDGIVRAAGFERRVLQRTFLWQVALYVRPA